MIRIISYHDGLLLRTVAFDAGFQQLQLLWIKMPELLHDGTFVLASYRTKQISYDDSMIGSLLGNSFASLA